MEQAKRKLIEFPGSGKSCYLPPVTVAGMSLKVQRKHPRPEPPLNKVDYGDGKPTFERNYADPEYHLRVRQWEAFVAAEAQRLAISRVYRMKLTAEQQAEVDALRAAFPDEYDETDSDTALWFEDIALQTSDDLMALVRALGGPDEEVIEAVEDSFRGDV